MRMVFYNINNFCAHKSTFKAAEIILKSPLTLVGSPPVIHLLQRKCNTMDPPVKFPGSRTKTQQNGAEAEAQWRGYQKSCDDKRGVCVWRAWVFFSGYRLQTTRKGCVFKQLFSKMELSVNSQSEASSPLLVGANSTLHSEDQTLYTHYASVFF